MNCERVISWLGNLEGGYLPMDLRTERLMRFDSVLRAAILLRNRECKLMTLHDIEGYSLDQLRALTGLPLGTIRAHVIKSRLRLGNLLSPTAPQRPPLKGKGNQL